MMDFEEFRQRLFLQICDKKDLDLKGENLKNYKTNFVLHPPPLAHHRPPWPRPDLLALN